MRSSVETDAAFWKRYQKERDVALSSRLGRRQRKILLGMEMRARKAGARIVGREAAAEAPLVVEVTGPGQIAVHLDIDPDLIRPDRWAAAMDASEMSKPGTRPAGGAH